MVSNAKGLKTEDKNTLFVRLFIDIYFACRDTSLLIGGFSGVTRGRGRSARVTPSRG